MPSDDSSVKNRYTKLPEEEIWDIKTMQKEVVQLRKQLKEQIRELNREMEEVQKDLWDLKQHLAQIALEKERSSLTSYTLKSILKKVSGVVVTAVSSAKKVLFKQKDGEADSDYSLEF